MKHPIARLVSRFVTMEIWPKINEGVRDVDVVDFVDMVNMPGRPDSVILA